MLNAKRFMVALALLLIGLGVAHAVATSQADKVARQLVDDVIERLSESGVQVTVGEVSANPYNKHILVETIRILDAAGQRHSIETVTLKNIELTPRQDFIAAMQIETRDAAINLLSPAINPDPSSMLKAHLNALNIDNGRVGHNQTIAYVYDVANAQLKLDVAGEFYHPDNRADPLFDVHFQTEFSRVPDLQQQLSQLENNVTPQHLSAAWLDLALNEAVVEFQDQGAWQPILKAGAQQAGVTEQAYREQVKLQWIQQLAVIRNLPPNVQSQIQQAIMQFVDSEQPEASLQISSKMSEGSGLMLTMMSSLIRPETVNNFFAIELETR